MFGVELLFKNIQKIFHNIVGRLIYSTVFTLGGWTFQYIVFGHPFTPLVHLFVLVFISQIHTLSLISLSGLSSVCYKTTLTTGGVGVARAGPPTSKLGTLLLWSLALSMPIYSNFQINGASGETLKPPDPLFLKQNRDLEVSEFLPKLHLFGNCYKSAYLEPRTITKASPIQKQEGQPQPLPHLL